MDDAVGAFDVSRSNLCAAHHNAVGAIDVERFTGHRSWAHFLARDVRRHYLCRDHMKRQDFRQLRLIFRFNQVLNRTGWKLGKSIIGRRKNGEGPSPFNV